MQVAAFALLGAVAGWAYFAILRASLAYITPGGARMGRFWAMALLRVAVMGAGFALAFVTGFAAALSYLAGFLVVRTVAVAAAGRKAAAKGLASPSDGTEVDNG